MPAVLGTRGFFIGAFWLALMSLARAEVIPLAVEDGHCECVLATPNPEDQFYVVVGSLAEATLATRINVRTLAVDGPEFLPLEKSVPDPAWKIHVAAQARFLELQRRQRPALDRFPPLETPPPTKTFHLFIGERDLQNLANYQAVYADLYSVGRFGQVYLDREDRNVPDIDKTVKEVLRIFDQDVYSWAEKNLGQVLDVDRDGRFTILLTRKLNELQKGKVQVDGFVRGSDFYRDLPAPYSNHCDMLYLNAALKPSPHLRTVMAHEFAHAVTFCEHALTTFQLDLKTSTGHLDSGAPSPVMGPTNQDEESWLNEGLSHLLENPQELGWSNLDYRVSAFLSQPEKYPLVIPDYFGAGLWRNPGTRGATFLFLRSCQEQTDNDLPRRLIQSPLRGIANLEAAAQKPFADLFRQATVDMLQPINYGYLDKDGQGPWLCGPHYQDMPLEGGYATSKLAGTAAAYFLLHSPAGAYTRLRVEGTGPLQVTLVRVPTAAPRLSLHWVRTPGNLRLQLTAHHGDIWLQDAGWEPLLTKAMQLSNSARWFEQERLPADTSIYCSPLPAPTAQETAEWVKVLGRDAQGRPVAAWIACP